jgi:TonB family protein
MRTLSGATMRSSVVLILLLSIVCATAQAQAPADPNASEPVHLAEPTAAALVIKRVPVEYPVKALVEGIQSTVVLNVTISTKGTVKEATVASGQPDFAQAAIDSIKKWKYKPYTVEGKPTLFATQVTFGFHSQVPLSTPPPPNPKPLKALVQKERVSKQSSKVVC